MEQPSLIPRDPILSFVDRIYESCDHAAKTIVAENLRQMAKKFAACQGEFFLIVDRHLDSCVRHGPECFPQPELTTIFTDFWLGIIDGEVRFGTDRIPIKFPIRMPYVSGNWFRAPKLWEGPLFLPEHNYAYQILEYLKQESFKFGWRDFDQPGLHLAVGDEEVKDLIRQYQWSAHTRHEKYPLLIPVYKMCLLLGRFLCNFPEQLAYIKKHRDLFEEAHKEAK